MEEKLEKLRAARVITGDLQKEYEDVLTSLSDDEVEVVASLSRRLDEAGRSAGRPTDEIDHMFIVI
jgi:hypothetical protein